MSGKSPGRLVVTVIFAAIGFAIAYPIAYQIGYYLNPNHNAPQPHGVGVFRMGPPVPKIVYPATDQGLIDAMNSDDAEARDKLLGAVLKLKLSETEQQNALALARQTLSNPKFASAFRFALGVLAVFGTKDDVPLAESVVDQKDFYAKGLAFSTVLLLDPTEGLAFYQSHRDPKNFSVYTDMTNDLRAHHDAHGTLAALELLKSTDGGLRETGVDFLDDYGSSSEIPALTGTMKTETSDVLRDRERNAIAAINAREKDRSSPPKQ